MTTENHENSEITGYPLELTGLTDLSGGDLGKVEIPLLDSIEALRFQIRVVKQQKKFLDVMGIDAEDKDGNTISVSKTLTVSEILDITYDAEGIELQIDLICKVMGKTSDELGKLYSSKTLNKMYAFIIRRDFGTLAETVEQFTERFSSILGTEKKAKVSDTEVT